MWRKFVSATEKIHNSVNGPVRLCDEFIIAMNIINM